MMLYTHNDAHTASVVSLGDHGSLAGLELQYSSDLASLQIEFDGVADFGLWVWISDGASVVCDDVGNVLGAERLSLHSAQLEASLLRSHAVQHEATLVVVQQTKHVPGLGHADQVHEARGEAWIGPGHAVHSHLLLHADHLRLLACQRVLQAVAQNQYQWKALA